jgi:hypothetical protein
VVHAHAAISVVQSKLLFFFLPARDNKSKKTSALGENYDVVDNQDKALKDRIAVLTIAYHNFAVE